MIEEDLFFCMICMITSPRSNPPTLDATMSMVVVIIGFLFKKSLH
jgi:hypothetical protein